MQNLTAKAGDHISATLDTGPSTAWYMRRGDFITIGLGHEKPWAVWRNDGTTITVARGWRLWYLRLLFNPVRRLRDRLRRAFSPHDRTIRSQDESDALMVACLEDLSHPFGLT